MASDVVEWTQALYTEGKMPDEERTGLFQIPDLLSNTSKMGYLLVLSSKTASVTGRMFKLGHAESVLGRSPDNAINLQDDGISRQHAKLVLGPLGTYELVDMDSTNGTFLNGERVRQAVLKDGDKIQIGSTTVLMFTLQDKVDEEFQHAMYQSVTRDGLTGIFNKKYLVDALNKEFAYCVRHNVPLALMMMDVDHFKKVNDTYGHPAGDFILSAIATKLTETVRTEDLLARYGGEEFTLLLRESTPEKAAQCAERCRLVVQNTDYTFDRKPIKVTISIGLANLSDQGFTSPEELISSSDKYLYQAKAAGRNQVKFKPPGP